MKTCKCGGVIVADTEDWDEPCCYVCYDRQKQYKVTLKFNTRCGCSKEIDYPNKIPPDKYIIPLKPRLVEGVLRWDDNDLDVDGEVAEPCEQREFQLRSTHITEGPKTLHRTYLYTEV